MKIELKKERFEEIESAFRDLKNKKDSTTGPLRKIKSNLQEIFTDKKIDVVIVDNKDKDKFFIMSVFPEVSVINEIVDAIVEEKDDEIIRRIWNGSDRWTIEIDSLILRDTIVDVNAKELTALLLHELGHIVYSNSIPQRISRVMRLEYARASLPTKALLKDKTFRAVLRLPVINACIYDNYKTKANIKKELKADFFVVKMGYADELEQVLTKLIVLSNTDKNREINSTSQKAYNDMKSMTLFSISTVEQFKERKTKVTKENFKKLLISSPSTFVKKCIGEIEDVFVKANFEDSSITESAKMEIMCNMANRIVDDMYMTEFFNGRTKKLKRIDPTDIDYILIEKDNIKNNDDKMMLISYIHSKIDIVSYYIAIHDHRGNKYVVPHSRDSLVDMLNKLTAAKDEVMKFRIPEPKYGIYISYPDGYDG